MQPAVSRFVVHQHKTGRSHFDLRMEQNGILRSWSLLKEPPRKPGERRLAIERESFSLDSMESRLFEEEAFGRGPVSHWDRGVVNIETASARLLVVMLSGEKIAGIYEFRRMRWYPGNRWILTKLEDIRQPQTGSGNSSNER